MSLTLQILSFSSKSFSNTEIIFERRESLLSSISDFLGGTKLLFTSHSPNLAKYLSAPQLYIGLPSEKGFVDFRTLKPSKVTHVLKIASAGEMSLGEYLFDLMLDLEYDSNSVSELFAKY